MTPPPPASASADLKARLTAIAPPPCKGPVSFVVIKDR